jgi:MerR family transcriptional regulator, light-induced transcriptional regulator
MAVPFLIGTVSKLTGISTDTLRAWERRYAAVTPKRGDDRRTYDQADVDRLILLRRAVERGHAISSVARLRDEELRALTEDLSAAALNFAPFTQPLLTALEAFDYAAMNETFGRIAAVLSPPEIVSLVVLPFMKEVGDRWHHGKFSVAQEHMASGLVHHLLGTLLGLHRPQAGAAKLIYTTPEGEMHSLGILAAAILAAGIGLSPIYLGPSLPPKEIVHAARKSGAKAVILQLTGSTSRASEQVVEILAGLPAGVELWLGGRADVAHDGALTLQDFPDLNQHYRRLAAT